MRITAVRFGRTVSKDFQSKRAEVEVGIDHGESFQDALRMAQGLVEDTLRSPPAPSTEEIERARRVLTEAGMVVVDRYRSMPMTDDDYGIEHEDE